MIRTLVILSVIEILALVAVLAGYLIRIIKALQNISVTLGKVAFGVRAVEQQIGAIGPGVSDINEELSELGRVLPRLADRAEQRAAR